MDKRLIVGLDIGQATTQAALFGSFGPSLRLMGVARVPTPHDPCMPLAPAVEAVLRRLESRTGVSLLDAGGQPLIDPEAGLTAESWFLTADSGGPLRVAVAGVIDDISGQSALKAALRAGASVADVLAINDGRGDHERARDLRRDPVDLILLAGGVDEGLYSGGGGRQVVNIAATIAKAAPRTRYNPEAMARVLFAGSTEARPDVQEALRGVCEVTFADNVRPDLAIENLAGARDALLEMFWGQIMPECGRWENLPAYGGHAGLLPSGTAITTAAELLAATWRSDLLIADIGETMVNLVSVIDHELNRTVSDELGLNQDCPQSVEALAEAASLWLPLDIGAETIGNVLGTTRIRPAALPQTWHELLIQHAAARQRLRTALDGHRQVAALIKGIHRQRNIDEVLGTYMAVGGQTIVDLSRIRLMVATGRHVARATSPGQVLGMMLDGIAPQGTTQLLYDQHGLLPHLGAMATWNEALAPQLLGDSWFDRLALVVAPVQVERGGPLFRRHGSRMATVRIQREDGTTLRETIEFGSIKRIPLEPGEIVRVVVHPERSYNAGGGFGTTVRMEGGGALGVVLDGRGRPIIMPQNPARRRERVSAWLRAIEAYPDAIVAAGAGEAD